MIVFTKGGDDLELPIHASLAGLQLEEVVLDHKDVAALANSSETAAPRVGRAAPRQFHNPQEDTLMDNQHKLIKGYRDLSQYEINLMNEAKALGEQLGALIERLGAADFAKNSDQAPDKRALALAKTNLQQGMMWLVRSIAKPASF